MQGKTLVLVAELTEGQWLVMPEEEFEQRLGTSLLLGRSRRCGEDLSMMRELTEEEAAAYEEGRLQLPETSVFSEEEPQLTVLDGVVVAV